MTLKLEIAQKKIEEDKKRLQIKERKIIEQKKKQEFKRLLDIGKLVSKAKIDDMDNLALLGAFLDISKNKDDQTILSKWKNNAEKILSVTPEIECFPLSIKFSSPPSNDVRNQLKELKFIWNQFLKVFYGHGNIEHLTKILVNSDCKIEKVE